MVVNDSWGSGKAGVSWGGWWLMFLAWQGQNERITYIESPSRGVTEKVLNFPPRRMRTSASPT